MARRLRAERALSPRLPLYHDEPLRGSLMPETIDASRKVVIEDVRPQLDCGRYAV